MPHVKMMHDVDPKAALLKALGKFDDFEVWHNFVLLAIYKRPEMTAGGIALTGKHLDEDYIQGKVGLVLKTGPDAFRDPAGKWFSGVTVAPNDWVVFRASDGWSITVNEVPCRMIEDTALKGRIQSPDRVW